MSKWIQAAPGIRYRKHPTRKHGAQLDRYYTLRFSVDGKQVEEALGWSSEGWTLKLAQEKLSELRKARRTGQGPATLREEAEANRQAAREKAEAEEALARQQRTVADLWDRYSKEVVAIENKPRTAAEKTRMWTRCIEPGDRPSEDQRRRLTKTQVPSCARRCGSTPPVRSSVARPRPATSTGCSITCFARRCNGGCARKSSAIRSRT